MLMIHRKIEWDDLHVTVGLGCFHPDGDNVAEFHVMIELNACYSNAEKQYLLLEEAVQRLMKLPELKESTLAWTHFFVSDAINQSSYIKASAGEAVSVVQQPPLNGSKVSLWLYFVEEAQIVNDSDGVTLLKHSHYTHLFHTQLHERTAGEVPILSSIKHATSEVPLLSSSIEPAIDEVPLLSSSIEPAIDEVPLLYSSIEPAIDEIRSPLMPLPMSIEHQTNLILNRYSQSLSQQGCTLERNCIRTWIFVQDVDVQYSGMVAARRNCFEREGLTPQTHYIASTGIEGRYIYPDVLVMMDAYAIAGIDPLQIRYLQATTHLNPTYEYGVTFERGTAVDYGDRRHIFISGTASINNRGEIVFPLDVEKQTARTFENVQALLAEADAQMTDVAYMIVYLRDTADYAVVKRFIDSTYPTIPCITVLAPVCRPGWLVEVECMAIKSIENKLFAVF